MKKWASTTTIGLLAVLVLLLAASAVWGYSEYTSNRKLENYLSNKYQRAFYDLSSQTQGLEVLLSKSLVASDPHLHSALLMDIRQQAVFAQSNLGQLPLNDVLAGRTSKFLCQLGDYADGLARRISRGEAIDDENWDTLNSLYQQASALNSELQSIQEGMAQNNFYFGEMVRQVRNKLQKPPGELTTGFQSMDEEMQRFPVLIYDGPFSEHLERAEPRNISGLEEIDGAAAEQTALAFMEKQDDAAYQVRITETSNTRIPSYRAEVSRADATSGAATLLDVSRQGGKVIWMLNPRPVGSQTISADEAKRKALSFLSDRGFGEMRSTYFQLQGNAVTFNFAALENGVTLYSDLVKVTVALDDGEIIGAECSGYLMSHYQRTLPEAVVSREHARGTINPRIDSLSGGELALIPTGISDETLAYEFYGKLGEDTYLIYINAVNGQEENIIKLIETPGGTLTM